MMLYTFATAWAVEFNSLLNQYNSHVTKEILLLQILSLHCISNAN